jgi:hypothetical protein
LQDDIVKFVSELVSPPRLVEIPDEGKGKAKECREVGEGDDTIVVEDTSEEDVEETLQEPLPAAVEIQPPWIAACPSHSGSAN